MRVVCSIRVAAALGLGLLAHVFVLGPAHASEILPAVSGLNGKLSAQGGIYSDEAAALALGSLSVPLTRAFGLQLDGALGTLDGDVMRGGAAHLFHRDPAKYLIGAYGSFHRWRSIDIWRAALEAEIYLGRFTVEALVGVESVSHRLQLSAPAGGPAGPITLERVDDEHFFAITNVAYYLQDNIRLSVGYRYVNEESLGAAGLEFLFNNTGSTPVSLFAEGQFGTREYTRAMAGVRIYLGSTNEKSLIRRHREDDPRNYVPDFFAAPDACPADRSIVGSQCVLPVEEEVPS